MIVYITGCLGFIGSYVTKVCLDRGWYVYGIDKCTYASNSYKLEEFSSYPKFKFEEIDICKIDRLIDCDYFINCGAETHVDNSIRKSDEFMHSNIMGVYNILELLKNYRRDNSSTPVFFQFSTDEVYGDIIDGSHTETDILKPSNPYSATKAAADQLITAWARTYSFPYIILRPTNNYGIGQYVEKLIPKSCKYLTLDRKIPLHDEGLPVRNWLHARDTASAVITIIESGHINQIFNVASNFEQKNIDTAKKIIANYFGTSDIDYMKYIDFKSLNRPGQDIRYALDDSKLKSLGWSAVCDFDKELVEIVDYYKHHFVW
jgi:dTDP-glucose 4,6-dehydratase